MGMDAPRLLTADSQRGRGEVSQRVSLQPIPYLCDFVIMTLISTDGPLGSYVQRQLIDIMENLLHNTEQERAGIRSRVVTTIA